MIRNDSHDSWWTCCWKSVIGEESSGALWHAFEGFAGGSLAVTQIIADSAVCFLLILIYSRMYSFTMAYQRRNRKEMSPVNSLVRVIENVWRYLSFAPANVAAQLRQFLALWTAWLWGAIFGIKAMTWWLLLYPGWHQSTTVSFARVLIRSGMESSWSKIDKLTDSSSILILFCRIGQAKPWGSYAMLCISCLDITTWIS